MSLWGLQVLLPTQSSTPNVLVGYFFIWFFVKTEPFLCIASGSSSSVLSLPMLFLGAILCVYMWTKYPGILLPWCAFLLFIFIIFIVGIYFSLPVSCLEGMLNYFCFTLWVESGLLSMATCTVLPCEMAPLLFSLLTV